MASTRSGAQAAWNWRALCASPSGLPPGAHAIGWAIARTASLCRALDVLAPGGDWPDRRYQLTPSAPRLLWRRCAPAPPAREPLCDVQHGPRMACREQQRRCWQCQVPARRGP